MSEPNRPDERFTLASERTFLAWMRTALALLAGGIAMLELIPGWSTGWVRTGIALVLIAMAAAAALTGMRRWLQVKKALETGADMPSPHMLWLFAVGLAAIAVSVGVATVLTRLSA
ncbi:putative membrane protein [Rhodococcus sp. 27YEA15]|uniref:YidH family protein n=1 Tax=Rhodococcus sp. 27YEA15 TaxID=3156259 RepID=UPI003C7D3444